MPRKTGVHPADPHSHVGFNEAAARCRRKRGQTHGSSRPPGRFNEAAARCRGKLRPARGAVHAVPGFNEAAARCRGKQEGAAAGDVTIAFGASMRPRPDAAENSQVAAASAAARRRLQ